jgi:hypothetical protein
MAILRQAFSAEFFSQKPFFIESERVKPRIRATWYILECTWANDGKTGY